jgi:four helix bundle protein
MFEYSSMATIRQFEDLVMWQKSRELTREVYTALRDCNDYGFKDQIQRASVSVMSNIAEGFESGTKQEFLNYLYIAKGSAGEVRSQLYTAHDVGYINIQTLKYLNALAVDCSRLVASFIYKLKIGGRSGLQYKHEEKKDIWLQELMEEQGLIMTERGVKKKEEAEASGLEEIQVR